MFAAGMLSGALLLWLTSGWWHDDPQIELYRAARQRIAEEFVRPVDEQQLSDDALDGMARGLDAYSRWYSVEESRRLSAETQGSQRVIGVFFEGAPADGRVLFALPQTPAARAGILSGERLLRIGTQDFPDFVAEGGLQRAQTSDTQLELTIEGLDGQQRVCSLVPAESLAPSVRHGRLLDREAGLGYLAVRGFTEHTPEEFDVALAQLRTEGLRGLVLDLRQNPGGLLESATVIANRFLDSGVIVRCVTRANREQGGTPIEARAGEAHCLGLPLVVLVDAETASASEVLAGALQDHRLAVLVGETTYGKGAVQSAAVLLPGSGRLKLTTAYYTTPLGRVIERSLDAPGTAGLAPEVEAPLSEAERRSLRSFLDSYDPAPADVARIRARELALGQELLPQPGPDPGLEAAIQLLRGERPGPRPLLRNGSGQ